MNTRSTVTLSQGKITRTVLLFHVNDTTRTVPLPQGKTSIVLFFTSKGNNWDCLPLIGTTVRTDLLPQVNRAMKNCSPSGYCKSCLFSNGKSTRKQEYCQYDMIFIIMVSIFNTIVVDYVRFKSFAFLYNSTCAGVSVLRLGWLSSWLIYNFQQ